MTRRPVLVTGAGGFIGRAVVARLLAAGVPALAGVRSMRDPAGPASVLCDLDRPETVITAASGAGAIVHAAVGSVPRMAAQLETLLDAASRAEIRQIILFSSVAVYGERDGLVDEDAEPAGRVDTYGAAKRRCEALVRAWAADAPFGQDRHAVLLRPGIVYGRGSRFWIDGLVERIEGGGWGVFGRAGQGTAALIHVDDVAEATLQALEVDLPPVAGFNLVGPDQPTWNDYFAALAHALGRPPLRTIGSAELAIRQGLSIPFKLAGRAGLPVPVAFAAAPLPGEMRLFGREANYRADRAVAMLGWQPRVHLAEGLERSLGA